MGVSSYNEATCSSNPTCTDITSIQTPSFSFFDNVFAMINPCCGLFDEASYYSLDGGSCLPCEFIE